MFRTCHSTRIIAIHNILTMHSFQAFILLVFFSLVLFAPSLTLHISSSHHRFISSFSSGTLSCPYHHITRTHTERHANDKITLETSYSSAHTHTLWFDNAKWICYYFVCIHLNASILCSEHTQREAATTLNMQHCQCRWELHTKKII